MVVTVLSVAATVVCASAVIILVVAGLCYLCHRCRFQTKTNLSKDNGSLPLTDGPAPFMSCVEQVNYGSGLVTSDSYKRIDLCAPQGEDGHTSKDGFHPEVHSESTNSDASLFAMQPPGPEKGQLECEIEYNTKSSELFVNIMQALDLTDEDPGLPISAFVKCGLLPHPGIYLQTKIRNETNNPVFMDRLIFVIESGELSEKTVHFQVCKTCKQGKHKVLGEHEIKMADLDLRRPLRVWMNLRGVGEIPTTFGEVKFSLSYLPTSEKLTVVVIKGRGLNWSPTNQGYECFVRVCLMQGKKILRKKKISTVQEEKNPVFNDTLVFSVTTSSIHQVHLRLSVVERLPDGNLSSIGHVVVGPQFTGISLTHWNQMMCWLSKPVVMWHSLLK